MYKNNKSHNKIVKKEEESKGKNNGFIGPLNLIKKVDLSSPMLTLDHCDGDDVLSNLPGQKNIWTAWPIFDERFCQFELDQWMDTCGPIPSQSIANEEYKIRKSRAMETLKEISTWNRT